MKSRMVGKLPDQNHTASTLPTCRHTDCSPTHTEDMPLTGFVIVLVVGALGWWGLITLVRALFDSAQSALG